MITPQPLKKGDKIALFAPARAVKLDELTTAISILESWGLHVVLPDLLFERQNQFAGDTKLRTRQVQSLLDDETIKAMMAVRGGYGCSKIVDFLDFSEFIKHPKWLIGFSDLTVFLGELYNLNISAIHGPVALLLPQKKGEKSIEQLRSLLFSEEPTFDLIAQNPKYFRAGGASGELVGGNLSVLVNQIGTSSFPNLENNILFIEDLDEYLYHIDRMMTQLERVDAFKKLNGVIVGHMSDMHDNKIPFGKDALKIIADVVSKYGIPFATGFSIGHESDNFPVIVGDTVNLNVSSEVARISNKFV